MFGAAAMSLSSICVVSNALRLKTVKIKTEPANHPAQEERKEAESLQTAESANYPAQGVSREAESRQTGNNNINIEGKEEKIMTKTIKIEGMACGHCTARVEKALQETAGVTAVTVSLEEKQAVVTAEEGVTDDALKQAVTDAGYEVVEIL
jgi:Cu+-exporting ATPase